MLISRSESGAQARTTEIKAVLFDLDGTLVDTAIKIGDVLNVMRRQRGLADIDLNLVRRSVSLGAEIMIQVCLGEALINVVSDLQAFRSQLLDFPAGHEDIYPGVLEALEALAPRATLAVVTNKPEPLARTLLESLGIAPLFSVVVGGGTAAAPKPSAAPIAYALAALGCAPEHALMVGDSDVDAAASAAAGCRFALFTGGYGPRTEAPDIAEFEFGHFKELVETVLPLAAMGRSAALGL